MYSIANEGALEKAKKERAQLEAALENAEKLDPSVITAVEHRLDECVRAIEGYGAAGKEPTSSMEDVTAVLFTAWNSQCGQPGCTKPATVVGVSVGLFEDGDIKVGSSCEEHARGRAQNLIAKMGFFPTESGMLVNMGSIIRKLGGVTVNQDKLSELHARLEEEAKDIPRLRKLITEPSMVEKLQDTVGLPAAKIEAGDQVFLDSRWHVVNAWGITADSVKLRFTGDDKYRTFTHDHTFSVWAPKLDFEEIAIGDVILMPDNTTWCHVGVKQDDLLLLVEGGFSRGGRQFTTRMLGGR